ncbi:MAG: hypothetical protein BWK77_05375 [Verrucomicrobia bacterium A1]|nr:MAG: hypothetical protein BWK77_05375 [Verrucomicrobia bacterium A1]
MWVNRWGIMTALALTVAGVSAAQAQDRARILGVDRRDTGPHSGDFSSSLLSPRLPKFMDGGPAAGREVFDVRWRAPAAGLPAQTLLTFEYRQEYSDRIRFLSIRYPFRAEGERNATFEITPEARRRYGRVTAWRARVVLGGRVLAELSSKSWR